MQHSHKTPLKIIAVGNDLYGDDGVGVEILNMIKGLPEFKSVPLIDCATDAFNIVEHMKNTKHVFIIDAAKMGKIPGTVKVFDANKAIFSIKTDHLSVHGISLTETMEIAKRIDAYPESVTIMGIEPEELQINTGLSKPIIHALPVAMEKIIHFKQSLKNKEQLCHKK